MIGNDVVDLIQARQDSNWQRSGFLDKLFLESEQLLIAKAKNPEIMVWMLWSMKEAAYKILNRKTQKREYIPKQLLCSISSSDASGYTGFVRHVDFSCYTQTRITEGIIHTFATAQQEDLKWVTEVTAPNIIKDEHRIPWLYDSASATLVPVSVSHHGRCTKVVQLLKNPLAL